MPNNKIFQTAENGSLPHTSHNDCGFCSAKGVPILPVRYAAVLKSGVIAEVTENLPIILWPEGYLPLTAHYYTLRLLRSGYLYLFDQTHQRLAGWRVTDDAKFQSFALNDTDENGVPSVVSKGCRTDEKAQAFSCKSKANHIPASMIHWPANGQTIVWLLYSELPIPTTILQRQVNDIEWRRNQMQRIDLSAPSGTNLFSPDCIPKFLAEHYGAQSDIYAPHEYHRDPALGSAIGNTFATYMASYKANSGKSGVMVALQDDLGVAEKLNHDRHLSEHIYNEALGHALEEKDDVLCTAVELETRRKMQAYNVFNMLLDQYNDEAKAKIKRYADLKKTPEGISKLAVENQPKVSVASPNSYLYVYNSSYDQIKNEKVEDYAKKVEADVQEKTKKVIGNFLEYVNADDFHAFKEKVESAVANRNKQLELLDKDYSQWMITRDLSIRETFNWVKYHPLSAFFCMPIILRSLIGNVMTVASHKLWHEHLLVLDSKNLLTETLGLHDDAIVNELFSKLKPDDEQNFFDKIWTGKNLSKLGKEVNNFIAKTCKSLTDETVFALIKRTSWLPNISLPNMTELYEKWTPFLTRCTNIFRRLRGESWLRVATITMSPADFYNFIKSLPNNMIPGVESNEMHNVATVTDSEGNSTQIKNKPYSEISLPDDASEVTLQVAIEDKDVKGIQKYEHDGERPCTLKLLDTEESITIKAQQGRKLQMSFANIMKQDIQQSVHSSLGVFFALYSLYGALQKKNDNVEDLISLVSSILGVTKASVSVVDTGRKALVLSAEVKELRLVSEAPWCLKVTMASNILGVVTAGFEVIHALQAWIDGEPDRVVKWLSISSAVSVAASVLGFFVLGAGAGLIVGVVSVVLGVLFADWAAQELTVPQRLWIHRGVFGRHEVNYRDSEPFGGQMSEQAHAYFDCQTNRLCINQPYGGVPSSESEEAYKAYQLKALTEEKLALGMLVRGITLEVSVYPGGHNMSKYFSGYQGTQKIDAPDILSPMASIKLTIPSKIDGIIKLELNSKRKTNRNIFESNPLSIFPIEYEKKGTEISFTDGSAHKNETPEFIHIDNDYVFYIDIYIEDGETYEVIFCFSNEKMKYIPIARDKIILRG